MKNVRSFTTARRALRLVPFTAAAAFCACSSSPPGTEESASEAPLRLELPCPTRRVVLGQEMTYVIDRKVLGHESFPAAAIGIAAMFPSRDDPSTWTTVQASARGNEAVLDVPDGPFDLFLTDTLSFASAAPTLGFHTRASRIELGNFVGGIPHPELPAPGTTLDVDVTDADAFVPISNGQGFPYQDSWDDIFVVAPASGWDYLDLLSYTSPDAGATTLHASVDFNASVGGQEYQVPGYQSPGLITTGQDVWINDLVETTPSGATVPVWTITRSAHVTDLDMVSGAATELKVSLEPVPQTAFSTTLHASAFDALAPSVHPGATASLYWGQFVMLPLGGLRGPVPETLDLAGGPPFLLDYQTSAPAPRDVPIDLTFGNPYPADQVIVSDYRTFYQFDYSVPSGDAGPPLTLPISAEIGAYEPIPHITRAGLRPEISPVTKPTIDGQDLFGAVTRLSSTPTLRWKAPALGSADYTRIVVYQVVVTDGQLSAVNALAELYTDEKEMVLPPGTMAPGNLYIV